ncbi:hypothetical protein GH714_018254 [Hevea brasiliensis]|uniref:Uncharacterized protein n=1 Tax=Hevea brasiliensis TaxID=3981 RepID=A0A6A6LZJ6_HEVBR|nr:hypothetical protein GH714_018254 [Hevea brasiliensis]
MSENVNSDDSLLIETANSHSISMENMVDGGDVVGTSREEMGQENISLKTCLTTQNSQVEALNNDLKTSEATINKL